MLSVVIPFLDEEPNLARYPAELFPVLEALDGSWQLVLIDDGSRDGSQAVARELVHFGVDSELVIHERNRGIGAAIRSGFAVARGDVILTLDADLTFAPDAIASLFDRYRRGDVDLVIGSPALAGYGDDVPWHRIALSRAANLLYQLALGRRLTAVTPIFRLYRAVMVRRLELSSTGFDINAEVLAKLLAVGARVVEVPATLSTRIHGESKLDNRAEIANHLRLMRRILGWRFARPNRPAAD